MTLNNFPIMQHYGPKMKGDKAGSVWVPPQIWGVVFKKHILLFPCVLTFCHAINVFLL